jgi:hypothetical protein
MKVRSILGSVLILLVLVLLAVGLFWPVPAKATILDDIDPFITARNPDTGCPWTLQDVVPDLRAAPIPCQKQQSRAAYDICAAAFFCRDHSFTIDECNACAQSCYYLTTSRRVLKLQMAGCMTTQQPLEAEGKEADHTPMDACT